MAEALNYRCHLMAMIAVVVLTVDTAAQSRSLLSELQRLSQPIAVESLSDYDANPASMFYRDSVSLSSLSVFVDWADEEKPVMAQLGDGQTMFGLGAESYSRRKSEEVVWGNASFRSGTYRNIRWSDCIDYRRVAPYVLGDEAGGNLSSRRYAFAGGYARRFSQWTVGIHAAYRAEIAFRNRDPRVKTVVSDLDIDAGATYRVSDKNILGFNAALNVYNQDCDLEFYNPVNEINTYTLTGLGTYYRRFMGNTNKSSGYKSFGYKFGMQWLPLERKDGLGITASFNSYRMEQQLRNFNNLTLGFSDNDILAVRVAYKFNLSDGVIFRPFADGGFHHRKSTENLFGASAGASYDKIGSRQPYKSEDSYIGLSLPLQFGSGKSSTFFTVTPSVVGEWRNESYAEPLRKVEVSRVAPEVTLDFSTVASQIWLWHVALGGGYAKNLSADGVFTELDTTSSLGETVMSNYSMLCADRRAVNASVCLSRPVDKNVVMSVKLGYSMTDYVGEGVSHAVGVTVSAQF